MSCTATVVRGTEPELLMRMQPGLDLHLVSNCKHMVHWDAFDDLLRLAVERRGLQETLSR
mgnify:CR=1 FL=1